MVGCGEEHEGLQGHPAEQADLEGGQGQEVGLGEFGKMFKALRAEGCEVVCFAGNVSRPDFSSLMPDARGLKVLPSLIVAARRGDDALLRRVLDEFEKVESIRQQSARAMADAEARQKALLDGLWLDGWKQAQEFVEALNQIGAQRGLLLTIRELRYIDVARIDAMERALLEAHERVATATSAFLAGAQAE